VHEQVCWAQELTPINMDESAEGNTGVSCKPDSRRLYEGDIIYSTNGEEVKEDVNFLQLI